MDLGHFACPLHHVIVGVRGDPKTIFLSGGFGVSADFGQDFCDILGLFLNGRQTLLVQIGSTKLAAAVSLACEPEPPAIRPGSGLITNGGLRTRNAVSRMRTRMIANRRRVVWRGPG